MHAKTPAARRPLGRLLAWPIAIAGGSALAWSLRGASPVERGASAVLIGLLIVLLGEIASALSRPIAPRRPIAAEPADGRVGIVDVEGVRSDPNPIDPRWGAFVAADPVDPRPIDPRPAPLLGRIAIFSLFVGRDGSRWTPEEIAKAHKALIRGGEWVEREAIRWGAPANVELAGAYFVADDPAVEEISISVIDEGDHSALFESDPVTHALASATRASSTLGFRDVGDLVESIGARVEADARVWLLHLRRAGRSHAIPAAEAPIPGVAMAVCYARESNFPEPLSGPPFTDPVTVVHELFHLFGASDKYGLPLRSFPPKSVTERDVMRLDSESLSRLRVDPATAAEVGWAP